MVAALRATEYAGLEAGMAGLEADATNGLFMVLLGL